MIHRCWKRPRPGTTPESGSSIFDVLDALNGFRDAPDLGRLEALATRLQSKALREAIEGLINGSRTAFGPISSELRAEVSLAKSGGCSPPDSAFYL